MSRDEFDFRIAPGRGRDSGAGSGARGRRLAGEVRRAAAKAGLPSSRRGGRGKARGAAPRMRGRRALAGLRRAAGQRRVVVLARIVRHRGAHFCAAPLGRHIAYLERDGVTREGSDAAMFDARGDGADRAAFAERCADDRHHFRLIVSPEDAADIADLRTFTRGLMAEVSSDLDTKLDWVAVDHWNTDNPHIHILLRGRADDGGDLVIDRGYVAEGLRARAEARVTLELGPRSEIDIARTAAREVDAERWTGLDAALRTEAERSAGIADLRPGGGLEEPRRQQLSGRAARLEAMGLAVREGPGQWSIAPEAEPVLRALGLRGDIIKSMHRDMARAGLAFDPAALLLHGETASEPVIGRLVARGLDDELAGSAYAIVDGIDGRTHRLCFPAIEATGDARPGAIVELRTWTEAGAQRAALALRSDLPLAGQVTAPGATWLDRQLVAREAPALGGGFGREVAAALTARTMRLETEGLAKRVQGRLRLPPGLVATLRDRDLSAAAAAIAARTGLDHRPGGGGDAVQGVYRERVQLSSGRFAMIDDGTSFELVPWRPALDRRLGLPVAGTRTAAGGIDWAIGRGRGLAI